MEGKKEKQKKTTIISNFKLYIHMSVKELGTITVHITKHTTQTARYKHEKKECKFDASFDTSFVILILVQKKLWEQIRICLIKRTANSNPVKMVLIGYAIQQANPKWLLQFFYTFSMTLYSKWGVKTGYTFALQFFLLISDSLGGVITKPSLKLSTISYIRNSLC